MSDHKSDNRGKSVIKNVQTIYKIAFQIESEFSAFPYIVDHINQKFCSNLTDNFVSYSFRDPSSKNRIWITLFTIQNCFIQFMLQYRNIFWFYTIFVIMVPFISNFSRIFVFTVEIWTKWFAMFIWTNLESWQVVVKI